MKGRPGIQDRAHPIFFGLRRGEAPLVEIVHQTFARRQMSL